MEILEFCPTTLNKNLVIGKSPGTIRMFVSFPLEPLGLRCKKTIMPLEWVLGRDIFDLSFQFLYNKYDYMDAFE